MVRGEINQHSLQEEILRRNINYAGYIQQKKGRPYVKEALEYEMQRTANSTTFLTTMDRHTEDIYKLNGMFQPYANPYENLWTLSRQEQKQVTHEVFQNNWKERINQSTKADTYRKFKPSMKFEQYLYHQNRKMRVNMTKLRLSDHKLMVEVGRHKRPFIPRPQRRCHMCVEEVEDETHFMTNCRLYGTQNRYWEGIYNKVPQIRTISNTDRLVYIMTQEDPELTNTVLKMNHEWMKFRKFLEENFFSQK